MKETGHIFFHEVIKTDDGKFYAVGEEFKRQVDGGGIAKGFAPGGMAGKSSYTKMVIRDLVFFEFGADHTLQDVKRFEKNQSDISLGSLIAVAGPQSLGYYMQYEGYFDYEFTQRHADNSVFTVGYIDFEKKKGEKNAWVFGAISYADGEFTSDKIPLETEAAEMWIAPGKPGYVVVCEYDKKEKTLDSRLEKINY